MGRLEQQKRHAILEANKLLLKEQSDTTVVVDDVKYLISWPEGNLKIKGPNIDKTFTLVKTSGADADLKINSIIKKGKDFILDITGSAWGFEKTLKKAMEFAFIRKIIKLATQHNNPFSVKSEDKSLEVKFTPET